MPQGIGAFGFLELSAISFQLSAFSYQLLVASECHLPRGWSRLVAAEEEQA